jgi:hypothetical protein
MSWWREPPWFATRSVQVVDMVRNFNGSNTTPEEFAEGSGFHGCNVVRLYTNTDVTDLKLKIRRGLELAWLDGGSACKIPGGRNLRSEDAVR